MKTFWIRWVTAICIAWAAVPLVAQGQAQVTVPAPLQQPAASYGAQVATEWFSLALQLTQQTPGFSPPVASRALAYLGLTPVRVGGARYAAASQPGGAAQRAAIAAMGAAGRGLALAYRGQRGAGHHDAHDVP